MENDENTISFKDRKIIRQTVHQRLAKRRPSPNTSIEIRYDGIAHLPMNPRSQIQAVATAAIASHVNGQFIQINHHVLDNGALIHKVV